MELSADNSTTHWDEMVNSDDALLKLVKSHGTTNMKFIEVLL